VSDTFEFIDAEYARTLSKSITESPPIAKMCIWLDVAGADNPIRPGRRQSEVTADPVPIDA
jgi:hypothetical protein